MALTKIDIRQVETRVLQDQLDANPVTEMDSVLASANSELIPPGRLVQQVVPSLVVTVGSGTVTNPNTSKHRVLPFISGSPLSFTGGTLTFPALSGMITVSPGVNAAITMGPSQFCAVLVQIDSGSLLHLVVGSPAGSLGAAVIPGGDLTRLSLGYVIVQSNGASQIQNVTNAMLYQIDMPSVAIGATFDPNTILTSSITGQVLVSSITGNVLIA